MMFVNVLKQVAKALYVLVYMTVIYLLFVLPWTVWSHSLKRLASYFDEGDTIERFNASEIKLITFIIFLFDALIFSSYLVGVVLIISLVIKAFFGMAILSKTVFVFLVSYFSPLLLSLLKETLSLFVIIYFKLEGIEENTREILMKNDC